MSSLDSMLESLVADDPRRSADRLLTRMCAVSGASGGAILVPAGGQISVFLSFRLSVAGLGSLQTRFQDHQGRLTPKVDVLSMQGFALAALASDDKEPLGWVYLEAPSRTDARELRPFLVGLAKAVAMDRSGAPRAVTSRAEANRTELLRLLEESDWNIAQVSREIGVTRRTLYLRLASFGIERKKVPRLAKPLTA